MFWLIEENDTACSNGGLNLAFKIYFSFSFSFSSSYSFFQHSTSKIQPSIKFCVKNFSFTKYIIKPETIILNAPIIYCQSLLKNTNNQTKIPNKAGIGNKGIL